MTDTEPPVRVLEGRFHLREQVGRGGFATVWRADDDERELPVAVKFPTHDSNRPEDVTAHFEDEYRIISAFESAVMPTSIVRFVAGSLGDPRYVVTEFVDGPTLATAFEQGTVVDGAENIRTIGIPLARALEFLHYNGYCYLDCKPQNVLIRTRDGSPVLVDFNTAARIDDGREVLFYEDGYKAPEQTPNGVEGGSIGPWSDVFALGKLLAYLLTERTIPTSETPDGIDPRESGGSCSQAVADVIVRATRREPTERYADAVELVTALLDALGEPTQLASLTHLETDLACPIRHGDSVGRLTRSEALPTIAIHDPQQYVSGRQFEVTLEDGVWLVSDTSLNGTFARHEDQWVMLLGDAGYRTLREAGSERVGDERPFGSMRVRSTTTLSPVDPGYPVSLRFDPSVSTG